MLRRKSFSGKRGDDAERIMRKTTWRHPGAGARREVDDDLVNHRRSGEPCGMEFADPAQELGGVETGGAHDRRADSKGRQQSHDQALAVERRHHQQATVIRAKFQCDAQSVARIPRVAACRIGTRLDLSRWCLEVIRTMAVSEGPGLDATGAAIPSAESSSHCLHSKTRAVSPTVCANRAVIVSPGNPMMASTRASSSKASSSGSASPGFSGMQTAPHAISRQDKANSRPVGISTAP